MAEKLKQWIECTDLRSLDARAQCFHSIACKVIHRDTILTIVKTINHQINTKIDFEYIVNSFATFDIDLTSYITTETEAHISNHGQEIHQELSIIANHADSDTWKFIAAWAALNEDCLTQAYSTLSTVKEHDCNTRGLMGQVLLEQGKAKEAIKSFQLALQLNKNDAVLWFQIAKAYYCSDNLQYTLESLEHCLRIYPNNLDCAEFLLLIMHDSPKKIPNHNRYWKIIEENINNQNPRSVAMLLTASLKNDNKQGFENTLDKCSRICLTGNADFVQLLPEILQKINERKDWKRLQIKLFKKLTQEHRPES